MNKRESEIKEYFLNILIYSRGGKDPKKQSKTKNSFRLEKSAHPGGWIIRNYEAWDFSAVCFPSVS